MEKNYPRIGVAVDAVVFAYHPKELKVLLVKRKNDPFKGLWAIPGGFVEANEDLHTAALRELKEETGIEIPEMEQLHAFGDPRRDPSKRVISIGFYTLVKSGVHKVEAADDAAEAEWFDVKNLPTLAFDHAHILSMALDRLRTRVYRLPSSTGLLANVLSANELEQLGTLLG